MTKLILASASPRRKELLEQLGYSFDVAPVDIDETPIEGELPRDYLPRMSKTKARAASDRLAASGHLGGDQGNNGVLVLASDTSVIVDNRILGKPKDRQDFMAMMAALSGQWHEVMTSIALVKQSTDPVATEITECTIVTRVKFRDLLPHEMEAYWLTGEPIDKAGGYGIQGKGAIFVEAIEGSYSNVVGLPLNETASLLTSNGLNICDIWHAQND